MDLVLSTLTANSISTTTFTLDTDTIALGSLAGLESQQQYAVAIGYSAGNSNQGNYGVAIGAYAGADNQGINTVAIGSQAGYNQDDNAIALGLQAGYTNQSTNAIAIGTNAGNTNQSESAIAIGAYAGYENQSTNTIVLNATGLPLNTHISSALFIDPIRSSLQTSYSLYYETATKEVTYGPAPLLILPTIIEASTIITEALSTNTISSASIEVSSLVTGAFTLNADMIAIGLNAGSVDQQLYAIAIGPSAGQSNQSIGGVAVGINAGQTSQGIGSVALGGAAGYNTQGAGAVAIGAYAAINRQGDYAIAIGSNAGAQDQSTNTIAIGANAGNTSQGSSAIAIGAYAGYENQSTNTIVLNATGLPLNTHISSALFIDPIRSSLQTLYSLYYETATKEVTYGPAPLLVLPNIIGASTIITEALSTTSISAATMVISSLTTTSLTLNNDRIALGLGAGDIVQGNEAIALGYLAGQLNQSTAAIAQGSFAGYQNQGAYSIALGTYAGNTSQGTNAIAIGNLAGYNSQPNNSIILNATGAPVNGSAPNALYAAPVRGPFTTSQVMYYDTTTNEITYGGAPSFSLSSNIDVTRVTATGLSSITLSTNTIFAGSISTNTFAVTTINATTVNATSLSGSLTGSVDGNVTTTSLTLNSTQVKLGLNAGQNGQQSGAIAIGGAAGSNGQVANAVAIGYQSGYNIQGNESIAIGINAGYDSQQYGAVAIGGYAGSNTQGQNAVAIGQYAGNVDQGAETVAIGSYAGQTNQGGIAIGANAGNTSQGLYAIAIGTSAGVNSQHSNSIILNASGTTLDSGTTNAFYVDPIRGPVTTSDMIYYNTDTKEITYGAAPSGLTSNLDVTRVTANGLSTVTLSTNSIYADSISTYSMTVYGPNTFTNQGSTILQGPTVINTLSTGTLTVGTLSTSNIVTTGPAIITNSVTTPLWLAVGSGTNVLASSSDGITWSPQTNLNSIFTGVTSVAWNGSLWVAVGSGASASIAYSTDGGITWSAVSNSKDTIFSVLGYKVVWNGRMWVASGNGTANVLAYSYDGITWQGSGRPSSASNVYSIAWNGRIWLGAGFLNQDLLKSTDGINWVAFNSSFNAMYDLAWNGYMWIFAGNGIGFSLAYSTQWDPSGFTEIDTGKTIFSGQGNGVAWNGSMWVAVGQGTVNTIAYSYDGINWTGLGTSIFSTAGKSVSWNGTLWTAVGDGTYTIAYSYNGINWFPVLNSKTTILTTIGNGIANNSQQTPDIATQRLNVYSQNVPVYQSSINQILALESSIVLNNTLYVNKETDRVGINTANPAYALDIVGNANINQFGSTTTTSQDALRVGNVSGGRNIRFFTNLNVGGFGTLTSNGDMAIAFSEGTVDTGNMWIGPHSASSAKGIKILANGNVGIGTAGPAYTLDVAGSAYISSGLILNPVSYGALKLQSLGDENGIFIKDGRQIGNNGYFIGNSTNYAEVSTFVIGRIDGGTVAPSQSLYINKFGNVGIGISSPQYTLDMTGVANIAGEFYTSNQNNVARITGFGGDTFIQSGSNYNSGSASKIHFTRMKTGDTTMTINTTTFRVGINTQTPTNTLEVHGTFLVSTASQIIPLQNGNIQWYAQAYTAGVRRVRMGAYNNSPAGHIPLVLNEDGGNVGIGISSPQYTLDVAGTARFYPTTINNNPLSFEGSADDFYMNWRHSNGNTIIAQIEMNGYGPTDVRGGNLYFRTARNGVLNLGIHINEDGNVGIGKNPAYNLDVSGSIYASGDITSGSDMRFKTMINTIENPISTLKELRGVSYYLKNVSTSTRKIGVIAQEIEKALPEVVTTDDSPDHYKAVSYGNIVALLIEAVKEVTTRVDELTTRVDELTAKVNTI
jgi:hypothetical protein